MRAVLLIVVCAFLSVGVDSHRRDKRCHRENEVQRCVKECPPEKTCRNRDVKFNCLHDQGDCELKCVCKKGFYRNPLGDCVPEKQCDLCPGPHEFYGCGSACDNVCSELAEQNRTSCHIKNIKCNEQCYCEDGYARNEHGVCVPYEECGATSLHARFRRAVKGKKCVDPNEVYSACKKHCPPETCAALKGGFKCDPKEPCKIDCICKPGYLKKNEDAPCMPKSQC